MSDSSHTQQTNQKVMRLIRQGAGGRSEVRIEEAVSVVEEDGVKEEAALKVVHRVERVHMDERESALIKEVTKIQR